MKLVLVIATLLSVNMAAFAERPIREIKERKSIDFPFSVDQTKIGATEEIRLYVSEDNGKTWKVAATVKPSAKFIRFFPPRDALYSFSVMTIYKGGQTEPESESKLRVNVQYWLKGVAEPSGDSER